MYNLIRRSCAVTAVIFLFSVFLNAQNPNKISFDRQKLQRLQNVSQNLKKPVTVTDRSRNIVVDNNAPYNDATYLVEDVLVTGCLTAWNITYTTYNSNTTQFGYFDGTNCNVIGFEDGVVLATGGITTVVPGPNNSPSSGQDISMMSGSGDPDLDAICNAQTYDACVLEFDFRPESDMLEFRYIFGSEEYPEYVCTGFNDVFGFFLTGPNPSGPAYNGTNIAIVPGTNTAVAINTVNPGTPGSVAGGDSSPCDALDPNWSSYSGYYTDNIGGQDLQFDGLTVPMTAQAEVTPCETYHIKLAVADAGDGIYDSAVFLEANSFQSGEGVEMEFGPSAGGSDVYEGCDLVLTFTRADPENLTLPYTVDFTITGSATPNVDYQSIPAVVTIPAGQVSITYTLPTYLDGLVEGTETITITLINNSGCPCSGSSSSEVTVNILDNNLAASINPVADICPDDQATFTANITTSSANPYTYQWSTGDTYSGINLSHSITVTPPYSTLPTTTTYYVTITDDCGNSVVAPVDVTVVQCDCETPPVSFSISQPPCCGDNATITYTGPGLGTVSGVDLINPVYSWNIGTASLVNGTLNGSGVPGTIEVSLPACDDSYDITLTVTNEENSIQCTPSTYTGTINVPSQLTLSVTGTDPLCYQACDGTASASASGGTGTLDYSWDNGAGNNPDAAGLCGGTTYTVLVTDQNGCTISGSFTPVDPSQVTLSVTGTDPLCYQSCDGTATATGAGGTGSLSYTWDNSAGNNANATDLCGGTTYNVTVSDANGCTETGSFTPVDPTQIILTTSGVDPTCGNNNGEVSVNVSGGTPQYTYLWDDPAGQTTPTATGLYAGTYTVIVTDANGCTETATVIISDIGSPTITVTGVNVLCYGGSDGSATVDVSGGQSPYSYQWDDPGNQTTQDATGLLAGTYNVTVTDAVGCEATGQIIISEPEELLLTVTGTDPLCYLACDGTATATGSGGTGTLSYVWDNSAGNNAVATNLCGGTTYNVTVTDENGCTNTGFFTPVDPPQILLSTSSTESTCGESNGTVSVIATGGTPGYTYLWDDPASQTTPTATGLPSGTYTVVVTDINGCTETAIAQVNDIGGPTVTISGVDITCNGWNDGEATVTASGDEPPFTFLWDDPSGQTTATATGLYAGTYNVTVTDNAGCNSYATITLSEPNALVITVTGDDPSCYGVCDGEATAAVTGGTGTISYLWDDPAAQNNSVAVDLCGNTTYTVLVTDQNGCTISGSFTPVEPEQLLLTVTGTDPSCNGICDATASGTTTGGTGSLSYLWDNGAGTNPNATGLCGDITYTLTVTDENGCTIVGSHTPVEPAGINIDQAISTDVTCYGYNDGTIIVVCSGGSGTLTYEIPGNSNTAGSFYGLGGGSYTVTITDANGCFNTVALTIYEPPELVVTLEGATICIGESVFLTANATGGTPGYDYTWNPTADGQTIMVSPEVTSYYSVLVTDSNFCVASAGATVIVHPPLAITAFPDDTICPGESSTFYADYVGGMGEPYSFTINGEPASAPPYTVMPDVTTTYTVCVNDGCSTPQACADVTIVVMDNPPVNFVSDIVDGCEPVTVIFNETNPFTGQTYNWNFDDPWGSTSGTGKIVTHTFDNPGTYDITCTVTSEYGCVNSYTWEDMITVYPNPVASFLPYPQVATVLKPEIYFENTSSTFYISNWEFGDGDQSNMTDPVHHYDSWGTFTVQLAVETEHGCVDTAWTEVVIEDVHTFYAPTAFTPDFDQSNALFSPIGHGIDPDNWYLAVFDRWGEKVWDTNIYDVNEETGKVRYGWDGTVKNNKPCEAGAYSWLAIYRDLTGAEHLRDGIVVVIR